MALFDQCVAAFKLDDLTDATGRGNDLTNNNSATFGAGKIGNAAYFTAASSQYLSHASDSDLALGAGSYTIGCWIYLASTPASSLTFISKWKTGDLEYILFWD